MCLDKITKRFKGSKRAVIAYKVLYVYGGQLYFPFEGGKVAIGKWMKAREVRLRNNNMDDFYRSGFHAYETRHGANRAYGRVSVKKVFKVLLRYVHTRGRQGRLSVLVAREMFIPEPKGKKAK